MASPNIYAGGFNLAGTVFENGPAWLSNSPSYISGAVQWLDTISGSDASSGAVPELAVKTLFQAVTNSAANGVIVIGEGSAETVSVAQTLNLAGLSIVGCGAGSSRPRYTSNVVGTLLNVTAAGTRIRNLYFPASTAISNGRINVTAASAGISDCYFECGAVDTSNGGIGLGASSSNSRVSSCVFVATASRPNIALAVTSAVTDVEVRDTTFDGGAFGWSDYAFKVSAAATRMFIDNVTLSNRANFGVTITGTSYQCFGVDGDGTGRVVITA